jgi:hypothetical protein
MSCDWVAKSIPLYFYGELTAEEEERVDAHVDECAACAGALERQRRLAAALDRRQLEPSSQLLEDCRGDLMAAVGHATATERERAVGKSPRTLFLEFMGAAFGGFRRWQQPIGAVGLVALGFFAARLTTGNPGAAHAPQPAGPSDEVYATVRSVQPEQAGVVRISFDETRRRELTGRMADPNIQRLLLAGTREDNPAVRLQSVDQLSEQPETSAVRDALLNALAHDPNAGVRLKALDGLKALANDPQVRKAVAASLVSDDNSAVRSKAVDLLVTHRDEAMVGFLQSIVQREDNDYVRVRAERALRDWNASVGTF